VQPAPAHAGKSIVKQFALLVIPVLTAVFATVWLLLCLIGIIVHFQPAPGCILQQQHALVAVALRACVWRAVLLGGHGGQHRGQVQAWHWGPQLFAAQSKTQGMPLTH
jgi:hypothetical protein